MSQKRNQKQLKRRKNKAKDAKHFQMREFNRFAQNMLAQMQMENQKEKASEPS